MSATTCTLQIFVDDAWHDAAVLDMTGQPEQGVDASTYLIYLPSYALAYWNSFDAAALSVNVPVDLVSYPGRTLRGRALFIPRFDREVAAGRVLRHGQESIASLCGVGGFGLVPSHNEACRRLGEVATDPHRDIVEYLKRDIAIQQACDAAKVDRAKVRDAVRAMAAPLATLLADARVLGIDEQFLAPFARTIENVRSQLEQL
jgi:hypothetical protein